MHRRVTKVIRYSLLCSVCLQCFSWKDLLSDRRSTRSDTVQETVVIFIRKFCISICGIMSDVACRSSKYFLSGFAPTRGLRLSSSELLQDPRTNLRFHSRPFHVSAPSIWNSLTYSVRFCESLTMFRKHLETL